MMKFDSMLSKDFLKNNPSTRLKTFDAIDTADYSLAARRRISMQLVPEPLPVYIQNNLSASLPIFLIQDIFEDGWFSLAIRSDDPLCPQPPPNPTVCRFCFG